MNKIIAVVAVGPRGLIAINGKMPWDIPEDLERFKTLTVNNTVIMGRKTWESLGKKCLPNRINYVVSRNGSFNLVANTSVTCFTDINYAISESNLRFPDQNVFIIGGAEIYKQTLPIWDELYLTIINKDQIIYREGEKTYLELDEHIQKFTEVSSYITKDATYKKFIRKVFNSKIKDKLF